MAGGSLFFGFFDTADRGAIDTIWQNLRLLPNCMGFAKWFRVSQKGMRNLSMTMNFAETHSIDVLIKSIESSEKI